MQKNVSVLVPTIPARENFLGRAISSIRAQEGVSDVEVIIGTDVGCAPLLARRFNELGISVDVLAESNGNSQALAVNAAFDRSSGTYIAILHDDDEWHPAFLKTSLDVLWDTGFCATSSLELDGDGEVRYIHDFPVPSGWVMPRTTFKAVGRWDESFRIQCDLDWLGRLGETVSSRTHLVESTGPIDPNVIRKLRPQLMRVLNFGRPKVRLVRHQYPVPLLTRYYHSTSLTHRKDSDAELKFIFDNETGRILNKFGRDVW